MTAPLPLDEAQARLLALAPPPDVERIAAADASGRYLAEPLASLRDQPAADLSSMDGFACAGEGPWRVTGESRAGQPFGGSLAPGEAARISTGAHMPDGADRVLIVEEAVLGGHRLSARATPEPGRFIRRRAFDFAEGQVMLDAGGTLGPAQIALALASGHTDVAVTRRPGLAIFDCGDELLAGGPHRLPASNGAMLAALAAPHAAAIARPAPVPDRLDALVAVFADHAEADLIVTSGGASVGEHDLIRPALEAAGYAIEFWRVAIKPGKPLLVARKGARLVLGLPGNPVSAFVTAQLFLLPLLRAMAGAASPLPVAVPILLAHDLGPGGDRHEFLRARLREGFVYCQGQQDSAALLSLARSDVLIIRPPRAPAAAKGARVSCIVIENGGVA